MKHWERMEFEIALRVAKPLAPLFFLAWHMPLLRRLVVAQKVQEEDETMGLIAEWLNKEITLEKLADELGYSYHEFVERWPVFSKGGGT